MEKYIISFDMDGTLVKPGFGDAVWLDGLPRVYAEEKHVSINQAKNFFFELYDEVGSDNREWYDLNYWIKRFNLSVSPINLLDKYEESIELFSDVKKVLKILCNDFTLIVSSGAMHEFIDKELEYTGIKNCFSYVFSATSDTETVKKDPRFYAMIANTLQCNPNTIIHIGDHLQYDYVSPLKAGWNAFYLKRNSEPSKPYIVSSLQDFKKIIYHNY